MLNYQKVVGILTFIIVGLLTLYFYSLGWFPIDANFGNIWVTAAAIILGFGVGIITRSTKTSALVCP